MTKNHSLLPASLIALLVASSPALALSSRTFVSGVGSDTGACPVTTPCRTFAYALTQTAPSGEIIVLTSAGYGPVTITQAVSIINTSNFAGVTVTSGDGITINAGPVVLRGLTIDGSGTGNNGIVYNSGGKLTIDQCNLMNFGGGVNNSAGNGILMQPTSGSHNIIITNTTVSNNKETGVSYYTQSGTTASAGIVIDRVTATNNTQDGIFLVNQSTGAATASVSNSIAGGNGRAGQYSYNVRASLDAFNASSNVVGVWLNTGTLALGRSIMMNNQTGLVNGSGTVNSYNDNRIAGNTINNVQGTITPVSPQ